MLSQVRTPGAVSEITSYGSVSWVNLSDVLFGLPAHADCSGNSSHYAKFTGFGFDLIPGSKISGVLVETRTKYGISQIGFEDFDSSCRLVIGNQVLGQDLRNLTDYTAAFVWYPKGGQNTLWGNVLTAADINASNFGLVFSVLEAAGFASRINFNGVRMTVYYEFPVLFSR